LAKLRSGLLDAVGTPLGTVQALLGHSSSEIMREIYLHSVPADARAAVEKVEVLLNGPKWTQVLETAKPGKPVNSMIQLGKVGRGEDLNLRPPGPETKNIQPSGVFSIHVSGASTAKTHVILARRSHSFSYGCPGLGAPTQRICG
jgi:hypothetical protein